MTMKLNNRLKECATTLLDEKLLAKLSGGDIISQEFVYHPQCLENLYNRERALLSSKDRSNLELEKTKQKVAFAFTELETYIGESELCDKTYKLTDLCELYKQRLEQLEVSTSFVNLTRLKKEILAKIPEAKAYTREGMF